MTRYRVEWQKNGVEYFDVEDEEGPIDLGSYAEDVVFYAVPNTVEFDVFVEGDFGWEQKL